MKIIFTIALSIFCQCAFCQMEGEVTDQKDNGISNAMVISTDSVSVSDTVIADERGFYAFYKLKKGRYRVEVKANGFESQVKEDINVRKEYADPNGRRKDISSATRLNFILIKSNTSK